MNVDKNPKKIKIIFDKISPYYDRMNDIMSFGLHNFVKKKSIEALCIKSNSMLLDICCGTGDFTKIIGKTAKVIGLDNSSEMIKLAKLKNPDQPFMLGDCTQLPFKNEEFDYVTAGFGLRNIENRDKAIKEIFRVLKHNGKFLHLDFGKHNFGSKLFDLFVPKVAKILENDEENYRYLINSKNEFPEPDALIEEFEECGFKYIKRKDFLFGSISAQIMIKN